LKSFLITYAEASIDEETKTKLNLIIADYYSKEMKKIYKSIDHPQSNNKEQINQYLSELRNMHSCLDRILENDGEI